MITIKANREETLAASKVSQNVRLMDIFLSKLQVSNNFFQAKITNYPVRVDLEEPYGKHEITPRNTLLVKCGTSVKARFEIEKKEENNKDGELGIIIEVEYCAEFALPNAPIPEDVEKYGFPAFARLNGPYICMPYLRQEIQNISSQMKLQIILPTLKIQAELKEEEEFDAGSKHSEN